MLDKQAKKTEQFGHANHKSNHDKIIKEMQIESQRPKHADTDSEEEDKNAREIIHWIEYRDSKNNKKALAKKVYKED